MDISYLLFLQDLRAKLGEGVCQVMSFLTKLSVSYWPIALAMLIFWAIDRKAGRRILGGFAFGLFVNGFLKVTCCVFRPWVRDARIEPWGDAKVAATGYSFPSGHSTCATAMYGGIGVWERKRHVILTVLLWALMLITMFSRNYLGVHTPQDVLVGCAATFACIFVVYVMENVTDKNMSRDWTMLIAGIVLCVAAAFYYLYKSYPIVYDDNGKLLADPEKMKADSFQGIGTLLFYLVFRLIERRAFHFDTELTQKTRLIFGIIAVVPGYFLFTYAKPCVTEWLGTYAGKFAEYSVTLLYGLFIVPLAMHIYARCRHIAGEK